MPSPRYQFCGLATEDVDAADGDGVTPTSSALAFPGAETLTLSGRTVHAPGFPRWIAPELADADAPWYGDECRLDEWCGFLLELEGG